MNEPSARGPLPAPRDPPSSDLVFTADFGSTAQWVAGRSWAYPGGGPVNPGDDKLDYLVSDADHSRSGTFRATRRPDGRWNTGLLTTEDSEEGFAVRTGDVLEARVRLPRETGAWPAIWTWRDGDQEIDVFEYHPDNEDLLEFTNHVRGTNRYHRDDAVRPGAWVDLRTEFGRRSVVWWLNGTPVFADGRGVGRSWHAYLIVNLSVCAGRWHPGPLPGTTEMSFEVSSLTVRRPSGGGVPHGAAVAHEPGPAPAEGDREPRPAGGEDPPPTPRQ
ncbi:family 16 glycosylhydrolase [Streptomyces sp. SID486]|uniref:family 16 glycosylhydrolase n=1 Tax=Streptomyces sp. SID486 TaxID=2690264 RepID=UPI0013712C2B|nr:family 16 glycosylhydrolase [Streptomyces sp. SID486]MYX95882.1 family 16 glycosylhydrolase [Streptomyces sp. SID486]